MNCSVVGAETGKRNSGRKNVVVVPLVDCIQSINLRSVSTLGKDATLSEMPLTIDDTARLIQAMTERLALVHAIPMATKELKKKTPANLLITVLPPPRRHLLFKNDAMHDQTCASQMAKRNETTRERTVDVNIQAQDRIVFPITNGMRGVSIGHDKFRTKCSRHAAQYTRCRCVLPITSTPAHIEALSLALSPVCIPSTSLKS